MQQYNYYSYLDYLPDDNKETINEDIDFEQFYEFYENLIIYSEKNNIDIIYLLENSHEIDKCIIYFELFDNLKQVAGNAVEGLKNISGKIGGFFKAFSINPIGVSKEFLKYLFDGLKNWSLIFNKINQFKNFIVSNVISGTLKALIKDLLKIEDDIAPLKFKQILKEKLEEIKKQSAVKNAAIKTFRIFLGGIIGFAMINVWLVSAVSGLPGIDINVGAYIDLFDPSIDIFATLSIEYIVEALGWYFLNSDSLSYLPQAYAALIANVEVIGFLFGIGMSIRISKKYLPDNVKKAICITMAKMRKILKIFFVGIDVFKYIIHIAESLNIVSVNKNEKFCHIEKEKTEDKIDDASASPVASDNESQKTQTSTKNNSEGLIKDHYQDAIEDETIKKFLVKIESMSGEIKNKDGKPYALGTMYGFQTMQQDMQKNNEDKKQDIADIINLSNEAKKILIKLGYDKYKPINTFLKEHKDKLKEQNGSSDKINWFYENKVANNFTLKRIFYN